MKKSILAMLFVLFGLVAVPLAYADEEMSTDDSSAAAAEQDEPLPPMMEELPMSADDSGS